MGSVPRNLILKASVTFCWCWMRFMRPQRRCTCSELRSVYHSITMDNRDHAMVTAQQNRGKLWLPTPSVQSVQGIVTSCAAASSSVIGFTNAESGFSSCLLDGRLLFRCRRSTFSDPILRPQQQPTQQPRGVKFRMLPWSFAGRCWAAAALHEGNGWQRTTPRANGLSNGTPGNGPGMFKIFSEFIKEYVHIQLQQGPRTAPHGLKHRHNCTANHQSLTT